jgi:hypothetical protein
MLGRMANPVRHRSGARLIAVGSIGVALALAGCGQRDADPSDDPAPATQQRPSETETSQSASTEPPKKTTGTEPPQDKAYTVASVAGTWHNDDLQWVLHLKPSGAFVEDFNGVKKLRTGTFSVDGRAFGLEGGDGETMTGMLRNARTLVLGDLVLKKR